MADDRDALIATLTAEKWERVPDRPRVLRGPNGWLLVEPGDGSPNYRLANPHGVAVAGFQMLFAPNAVILAAARAAVEAES